ncbi:hypothetical protein EJ07DRAFT_160558 [Lizonia empirigonia]|nr:hypothetical protein EJ07DRAFT_160558 [Lizonia empirigonia]
MVTTRRQSKTIEPPALPPVAPPKRKRKDDAAPAPSAVQPPSQPSSKRRRKGKDSANGHMTTGPFASTLTEPVAKKVKLSKKDRTAAQRAQKQGKESGAEVVQPPRAGADCTSLRQHAQVDLTNADDDSSSGDEAIRRRRLQPAVPRDADDDEADSRYALSSRREGKAKRLRAPTKRRTAELKFEEDGLEEVDKADAAVANVRQRPSTQAKKCLPSPSTLVNDVVPGRLDEGPAPLASKKGKNKVKRKVVSALGRPSKVVMFTAIEAIAALSLYQGGTMSIPAKIDPHSRQPYASLQTGEHLSYPVKGTYHLGSTGRYCIDTVPPPLPFALTVPLSEHSFIQHGLVDSATSPPRHGLGFADTISARSKVPSLRRPNNYCFTFGKYKGRRMDSVPIEYLRSICDGDEYYNDAKLQQAFKDLYPKGRLQGQETR